MRVFYTREELPETQTAAIFLAGPTPREAVDRTWRQDAVDFLQKIGFPGEVFLPENRDPTEAWENGSFSYAEQVDWEEKALNRADVIVFWIPRDMDKMPGLTTNGEFGFWSARDPAKVVLGTPPTAEKVRYQEYNAQQIGITTEHTLEATLVAACDKIRQPMARHGGEAEVPLHIWRTASFQRWMNAQWSAGNRLDGARVLWAHRVGPQLNFLFSWSLKVNVYVREENRNKVNEFVVSRTDISCILAYCPSRTRDWLDSEVILVREFRSPSTNPECFVWELPGGSSFKPGENPQLVAMHELQEEAGLVLHPERFKLRGSRQLAGTWSAHHAHLFSVQLTEDEIVKVKEDERKNKTFGVQTDSEITYVRVRTVREIIREKLVDYATLGMILEGM
jgi:ADP-ribose pyrophosphatase YjhB (NUDIX family)/nucleoside 2-deoxyribosyltransferase